MTHFMNAPLPASTTLDLVRTEPPALPAGITELDAARITRAIAAAKSETTRGVYAQVWGHWERWCARRGTHPLPADPLALSAYLTERAEDGKAISTLDMSCTVIRHVHRMTGTDDPVASEAVRQVRRGLVRTYGAAPRRLARPLTIEEIRQIVAGIDRTTPIGIRDTAIILLGYASALGRGELVGLTLTDVEHKPAGLLLQIRQSKTDRDGHGRRRPRPARPHRPRRRTQRLAGGPRRDPGRPLHPDMGQLGQPPAVVGPRGRPDAACPR